MGKRTSFQRRARDFYATPAEATTALIPHLDIARFDEPCAGAGDLVSHLEHEGFFCGGMSDIKPQSEHIAQEDAFNLTGCRGEIFVTNPPWDFKILDPLIKHLTDFAPAFLLLNADVMHNKRMSGHMRRCKKIVSVGRISWMGNGKKGFENCAWMLFVGEDVATEFFGRSV